MTLSDLIAGGFVVFGMGYIGGVLSRPLQGKLRDLYIKVFL